MNCFHISRHSLVLTMTILGLVVLGRPMAQGTAVQVPLAASSLLIDAAPALDQALVTGRNFTPGGEVSIALYDQWGRHLQRVHRFTASAATFGPNGSQDPATGYVRGGTFDQVLRVSETVYGPNGSQDPATGYVRGILDTEVVGSLCGTAVMVRAYDARAAAWSNMLDIDPGC